jgi:hypothetical protein
MRNAAASRGRRVRHDRNSGALEQIGQRIFQHIATKFNAIISRTQLSDRLRISRRLWMVSAGNHEFGLGQFRRDHVESLDHQLEPFVRSPLAERQNAVDWSTTSREIWEFGSARQDAVGS